MNNKCLYCYNTLEQGEKDFHAKCSHKFFGQRTAPVINFGLDEINELAKEELAKRISVTGVQPKLSLELEKERGNESRLTIVDLWGQYILKPPFEDYPEMPELESLTMHLAKFVNIKTAEHSLIRLSSGELAYISKRFDRTKTGKVHVEDMAQLTETLTERKYKSSMEKVAKTILNYSDYSMNDLITFFELALFCCLTGNADMHLKNFSLIITGDEEVMLAPAYDLLATKLLIPEDTEEFALPMNGKKSKLRKGDFDTLAASFNINPKTVASIYNDIKIAIPKMLEYIEKSFLSEKLKQNYIDLIESRRGIVG